MRFGVFDHMDRHGANLGQQYRDRLHLIEAYDRAGFYAYHLAEHHGTPLGLASSPSVFLAAVAQRTRSLRFGPLVYTLSLYHPLRAVEEICMLDQLSAGRLELGIGRGVSPIELSFYGVGDDAQARYEETLDIILKGLRSTRLNHEGKYYAFNDVPIEVQPVQQPHPPLWYGVARPETAAWAATKQINIVMNAAVQVAAEIVAQYHVTWRESPHAGESLPHIGMSRHVVVGQTERGALELATPAYEQWYANLLHLWRLHKMKIPLNMPENITDARTAGLCVVGNAASVREQLAAQIEQTGINYLVCRLAFGNLPMEATLYSVTQLRHEIMPAFQTT